MLNIENSYAAFCLDEAVVLWGNALEAELEKVTEKAKTAKAAEARQKLTLDKWLKMGDHDPKKKGTTASRQQYRDPREVIGR